MYRSIYVPVDNSDYSNRATELAVALGRAFESKMVGCHVYAARMHEYRFKQMEYSLPEEYLEENELERQRKIHDSLITMGLQLISESYLEQMKQQCEAVGLEFEPKMMDGKHHVEIVKDMLESRYDLTVLGVLGIGRVRDSQIGSVCERVLRASDRDVWVVKRIPEAGETEPDTILVGVDGSPQSFGALMTAIDLAKQFNKKLEVISVYDPYLHYSVFQGLVNKLTKKASKVFRFEEQNQLHEEIIDTGLAQIYQSHLNVAEKIAQEQGADVTKTLLDGKAFQKVLDRARKLKPWVLVLGRVGVHSQKEESGLGSNTENLLRLCPCDMLFSTRLHVPDLDVKAEESILWSKEAQERMKRVPELVRGIARTGILRLAVEQGHSVITNSLIDEAMERFMPKRTQAATNQLAEALAFEKARRQPLAICRKCGVTATEPNPVRCSVCGGEEFETISEQMIDAIAGAEGGVEEETTYDGKKLNWTKEARRALSGLADNYQRRRAKARIEKSARTRKLDTITMEFARTVIEEETGKPLPVGTTAVEVATEKTAEPETAPVTPETDKIALIATDAKGIEMRSAFAWTEDAIQRVLRVPGGFMRDGTQQRVEGLASERNVTTIDLALVEDGLVLARKMMAEMMAGYGAKKPAAASATAPQNSAAADECPAAGQTPSASESSGTSKAPGANPATQPVLNEVGLMSELARTRNPNH